MRGKDLQKECKASCRDQAWISVHLIFCCSFISHKCFSKHIILFVWSAYTEGTKKWFKSNVKLDFKCRCNYPVFRNELELQLELCHQ